MGAAQRENVVTEQFVYVEKPVYDRVKRVLDIVCSGTALLLLSPILLLSAVAILIDDFGNPIYRQIRIGKDGKAFTIYKFRSMYKDADEHRKELLASNEGNGANFKLDHDPRVTRVGDFLRRTSIDELPQLVNILKGDMSVIGPRPFIPEEQAVLPNDRLRVRPGLSCYWQISGKNLLSLEDQIALDRKYIEERTFMVDLMIVWRTLRLVFGRMNH